MFCLLSSPTWQLARAAALSAVLFLGMLTPSALGAQVSVKESTRMAALIRRFAQYVEWPGSTGEEEKLIICTLGKPEIHDAVVNQVHGRVIRGRTAQPAFYESPEGVEFCHLLFLPESQEEILEEVFQRLEGRSVLTVSDMEGFVESGGMIGFMKGDKGLAFEINAENARRAGLRLRGRLLVRAERVIGHAADAGGPNRGGPPSAEGFSRNSGGPF